MGSVAFRAESLLLIELLGLGVLGFQGLGLRDLELILDLEFRVSDLGNILHDLSQLQT